MRTGNILATAAFCATTALAGHGGGEGRAEAWIAQRLQLTPAQQEKVQEIRKSGEANIKALRQEMRTQRKALGEAARMPTKGPEYQAKLRNQYQLLEQAMRKVAAARFEQLLAIREILEPSQLEKFRFPGGGRGLHKGGGKGKGAVEDAGDEE